MSSSHSLFLKQHAPMNITLDGRTLLKQCDRHTNRLSIEDCNPFEGAYASAPSIGWAKMVSANENFNVLGDLVITTMMERPASLHMLSARNKTISRNTPETFYLFSTADPQRTPLASVSVIYEESIFDDGLSLISQHIHISEVRFHLGAPKLFLFALLKELSTALAKQIAYRPRFLEHELKELTIEFSSPQKALTYRAANTMRDCMLSALLEHLSDTVKTKVKLPDVITI